MSKSPVIFLYGPTATGKTELAAALLDHMSAEIVSVDSALIYREMDIGSAKPDAEFLARAPHHLLNIRDPSETYSAAEFARDAIHLLREISGRGKIPLLVGGTMLYFRVLLEGLAELPPSDPAVREMILAEAEEVGWPELHRQLAQVDPETAAGLHPNHSQRIQRALEIYRLTGKPASQLKRENVGGLIQPITRDYNVLQIAMYPRNRSLLHERIAHRFVKMLAMGFENEVRSLHQRGDLDETMPAIKAVGYRQMWQYLEGTISYSEMVDNAVAATRQLAKRQLTWLRNWPEHHNLYIDDEQGRPLSSDKLLKNCLKILEKGPIYNFVGK